jgi:hypothetical protein
MSGYASLDAHTKAARTSVRILPLEEKERPSAEQSLALETTPSSADETVAQLALMSACQMLEKGQG